MGVSVPAAAKPASPRPLPGAGTATTAAITVTGVNGTWQYNPGGTPGNDALYTGYLDEFNPPGADSAKVTVSQIPYALYDVYIYSDSDNATENRQGVYTIGGTTYYMGDTAKFSGAFVRSADTDPADGVDAGNYLLFQNVSGPSFTLDAGVHVPGPARDDRGAMINGIQIVEVPEPAALSGLLLAAAPSLLRRRRQPA